MTLDEAIKEMPQGWYKAFGKEMHDELYEVLTREGLYERYKVIQIKEKFGELRWYDDGGTTETDVIVDKFSDISSRTCIMCGKPATKITLGWICPYCTECCEKLPSSIKRVNIEEVNR